MQLVDRHAAIQKIFQEIVGVFFLKVLNKKMETYFKIQIQLRWLRFTINHRNNLSRTRSFNSWKKHQIPFFKTSKIYAFNMCKKDKEISIVFFSFSFSDDAEIFHHFHLIARHLPRSIRGRVVIWKLKKTQLSHSMAIKLIAEVN